WRVGFGGKFESRFDKHSTRNGIPIFDVKPTSFYFTRLGSALRWVTQPMTTHESKDEVEFAPIVAKVRLLLRINTSSTAACTQYEFLPSAGTCLYMNETSKQVS